MDILEKIRRDRERRRERDQKIVAAREAGQTYAAIGRQFTLSGENVKARIDRYFREKRREESDDPFVKLSSRTLKILQREGLVTIDKVLALHRHNKLLCIRGFGRKSLREVEKWFHVARATPARTRDCIVQTEPLAAYERAACPSTQRPESRRHILPPTDGPD